MAMFGSVLYILQRLGLCSFGQKLHLLRKTVDDRKERPKQRRYCV